VNLPPLRDAAGQPLRSPRVQALIEHLTRAPDPIVVAEAEKSIQLALDIKANAPPPKEPADGA
jgi:hypothetical protein